MPLKDLFESVMKKTSWHHTSKYANETNFYAPDKKKIVDLVLRTNKRFKERNEIEQKKIELLQSIKYITDELNKKYRDLNRRTNCLLKSEKKVKELKSNGVKVDTIVDFIKKGRVEEAMELSPDRQTYMAIYDSFLDPTWYGLGGANISILKKQIDFEKEDINRLIRQLKEYLKERKLLNIKALSIEEI